MVGVLEDVPLKKKENAGSDGGGAARQNEKRQVRIRGQGTRPYSIYGKVTVARVQGYGSHRAEQRSSGLFVHPHRGAYEGVRGSCVYEYSVKA